ncbi:acyltransferase family protein, partial [Pantoea septica]|uniref:acyltransferase family protein n=1 Tax=Pantoea septica TaxID=472695 RepID=UPI00289A1E55
IFNRLASLHGLLFALGIAFVLYPVFTYSTNTTFPGINALMPVIGSMLIILSGDKTIAGHLLASRPVSYIGEISYSLYLVHWPVVVFAQYILVKEFSGPAGLLLVAASFALAIPMHRFIEKPLRKPGSLRLSGPAFCLSCSGIAMALMTIASNSWADKGWVWRLPEQIRKINDFDKKQVEDYVWKLQRGLTRRADFKYDGKEKLLILGDSQSADIVNMLNESGEIKKYDIVARTIIYKCGAPYIQPEERQDYWSRTNRQIIKFPSQAKICDKQMDDLLNDIVLKKANKIFISMHWEDYSIPKLQQAINTISSLTHAQLYLFGNKVIAKSSVDIANSFGRTAGISEYASKFRDKYSDRLNSQLPNITGMKYVDMMKITCPDDNHCRVLTDEMTPIFFDAAHLTRDGAKYFGLRLNNLISSIN